MPRKDRGGGDGGKGAKNPLADMFNIQMPEDDEEALMAELAALQGIQPPSKGLSIIFDFNFIIFHANSDAIHSRRILICHNYKLPRRCQYDN